MRGRRKGVAFSEVPSLSCTKLYRELLCACAVRSRYLFRWWGKPQEVLYLFRSALDLLHQVAHKPAARSLTLTLIFPSPVLLPIVLVRILLQIKHKDFRLQL